MDLTNESGCRAVITPTEEYIADEEALIRDTAKSLLKEGNSRIVFDLSNVKYLGDSGISLLIKIHRDASARGGDVGISGLRPELMKVFELTRLDKVFDMIPSTIKQVDGKTDK